jgi:serine/alanine adding enzyme
MPAPSLTLATLTAPSKDWDDFVRARAHASVYLLGGWAQLGQDVFGHPAYFIEGRNESGGLAGVLPLVRQKSLLFGDSLTSVPFFNYGGALADTIEHTQALMEQARSLALSLGCRYLEFRDTQELPGDWRVRTDKVTLLLDLPESFEVLAKKLGAKLRSQVKRAEREKHAVRIGGRELLGDFYTVFAHNMRDLGTPVYPLRFFEAIFDRFAGYCQIVVIDGDAGPSAAGFLIIANGRAEIPWAACLPEAKRLGFNMKLYWEVLAAVMRRGCSVFDFGRSTVDAGTYKFKLQWGAAPRQLYWHRWERKAAATQPEAPAREGRLMHYATTVWKRLPLPVANRLGPLVSGSLPW